MKLVIRAARQHVTFGPDWVWLAWLEPSHPRRDSEGNLSTSLDAIYVGGDFPSWEEAMRAGGLALSFVSVSWVNDAHGLSEVVPRRTTR